MILARLQGGANTIMSSTCITRLQFAPMDTQWRALCQPHCRRVSGEGHLSKKVKRRGRAVQGRARVVHLHIIFPLQTLWTTLANK
jgi:hypothetical protein